MTPPPTRRWHGSPRLLGILAVTTVASLLAARRDPTLRAHAGNLRGHQLHRQPEDTGATQHDSARR